MRTAAVDGERWASGGPALDPDLVVDIGELLQKFRDLMPGVPLDAAVDFAGCTAAIRSADRAVDEELSRTLTAGTALLYDVLRGLRHLDRRLVELQMQRSFATTRTLTRVLPRLEAATSSVSELVAVAPELVCELGFDRGLISRVQDNVWYPELMFVMGDPRWAAEITEAGKAMPQVLVDGLYETEIVRTLRPILVTGVGDPDEARWGHQAMVQASRTHSYVAAPLMSGGQVVGMLHGDRYGQRRDVDEVDRDLLGAFAEAFRLVLSRAALNDRMQATQQRLSELSDALDEASGAVHDLPVVRVARHPGDEPADGLLIRIGRRGPEYRPLPEDLTPRELEVLSLMAAGHTNLAIARQLCIADGTAKQHVKHILRKLPAANRSEAVARWFQAGGALTAPAGTCREETRDGPSI